MKPCTRSISLFMVLLLFLLLLPACDSGLEYVKMEIDALPEKTVYCVGEDNCLQFDGGLVKLTTRDGSTSIEDLESFSYRQENVAGSQDRYISSDVNFSVPGVYTVTIHQTKNLFCQYQIEILPGK